MKRPALILLILLLAAAITLGLIARQEEAVPAMTQVTAAPTAAPTAGVTAAPSHEIILTPSITITPTPTPTLTPLCNLWQMTITPTPTPTWTPICNTMPVTPSPTPTPTSTPVPTEAPTPEAVGGEMTLTVPGYRSDVTVSITVDGSGVITAMTVDASGEDAGLGKKCEKENWLEQFIGKTAPFALTGAAAEGVNAVDAVSYATITSQAVIDAVNTLLGAE